MDAKKIAVTVLLGSALFGMGCGGGGSAPTPNAPTALSGSWAGVVTASNGDATFVQFDFNQTGASVTGQAAAIDPTGVEAEGTFTGSNVQNQVALDVTLPQPIGAMQITGTANGDQLSGKCAQGGRTSDLNVVPLRGKPFDAKGVWTGSASLPAGRTASIEVNVKAQRRVLALGVLKITFNGETKSTRFVFPAIEGTVHFANEMGELTATLTATSFSGQIRSPKYGTISVNLTKSAS